MINKKLLTSIPLFLLISCSSSSLYFETINKGRELLLSGNKVDIQYAKSLPFSSLLVEYDGSESLLVLEGINNEKSIWVSGSNERLITRIGKIVETSGLKNDISLLYSPNLKNIFEYLNLSNKPTFETFSYISFSNPETHPLKIKYSYKLSVTKEFIPLNLYPEGSVYILSEFFDLEGFHWKGVNKYWMHKDGYVLRSKQYISPGNKVRVDLIK